MKWLYKTLRLFFRPKCFHKWELINSGKTNVYEGTNNEDRLSIYTIYVKELRCTSCGTIQLKKFKV